MIKIPRCSVRLHRGILSIRCFARGVHSPSFRKLEDTPVLVNFNAAVWSDRRLLLWQSQLQYTIFIFRLDTACVDPGDIKATAHGTIPSFAADVGVVIRLRFLFMLCGNGHPVAIHVDMDIFFVVSRKIGPQQVLIALVDDIGAARNDAALRIALESAVHLVEIIEKIAGSALKWNQIKHDKTLRFVLL